MVFDPDSKYNPTELDAAVGLSEEVDNIVSTLQIPQDSVPEPQEEDTELESITVEIPTGFGYFPFQHRHASPNSESTSTSTRTLSLAGNDSTTTPTAIPTPGTSESTLNNQLHTPSATPEPMDINSEGEDSSQPVVPGHRSYAGMDKSNIMDGKRRRGGHAVVKKSIQELEMARLEHQFDCIHASFATAYNERPTARGAHRSTFPSPPRNWKEMLQHTHKDGFHTAAQKEWDQLLRKGTFKLAEEHVQLEGEDGVDPEPPLPLMWVFTYKFDDDGYFLSFKARLVARGDLQATEEETYAATLAAQMFRLCMALMCNFDIESRQYDALNAFANAKNRKTLRGQLPDGFKKPGWIMLIIMALYGLKTSPLY